MNKHTSAAALQNMIVMNKSCSHFDTKVTNSDRYFKSVYDSQAHSRREEQ